MIKLELKLAYKIKKTSANNIFVYICDFSWISNFFFLNFTNVIFIYIYRHGNTSL